MSFGPRQPRPDPREKTLSQLNPKSIYSNTLCEINGVYVLPRQMSREDLRAYMTANGKEQVENHPDLSGFERGDKADREGRSYYHHFSGEDAADAIRRAMAEKKMYREW